MVRAVAIESVEDCMKPIRHSLIGFLLAATAVVQAAVAASNTPPPPAAD
jgi:hypothetical protein